MSRHGNPTRRAMPTQSAVGLAASFAETDASRVGRENVYTCETCGGYTVTVDRDAGVTPMFLACRASGALDIDTCAGIAVSAGYPNVARPPYIPPPAWEWYRPTTRETHGLDAETFAHVRQGGLLLRKIGATA